MNGAQVNNVYLSILGIYKSLFTLWIPPSPSAFKTYCLLLLSQPQLLIQSHGFFVNEMRKRLKKKMVLLQTQKKIMLASPTQKSVQIPFLSEKNCRKICYIALLCVQGSIRLTCCYQACLERLSKVVYCLHQQHFFLFTNSGVVMCLVVVQQQVDGKILGTFVPLCLR